MQLKLRSSGRGRHFSVLRGLSETVQGLAYTGAWPARLLDRVPAMNRVAVREHRLPLLPAGRARRPLRVAFLSDLHLGPLTPRRLCDRAFAAVAALAPDVLLLGGDYVFLDCTPALAGELRDRVAALSVPTKLAVLGNHDLWTCHDVIERALADAGARVLVNQAATLPPPFDDVAVVGLDDPWTGATDPVAAFAQAGAARLKIALAHAPEGYPLVRGHGARLFVCGHTHGGQVALPSGPIVVHGPLGRRWPAGLYALDDLHLFVSRGIGNVDLPLRLFAPPDVALFSLEPAA
jgi:predicted MPP superfamily phosphohydrolase